MVQAAGRSFDTPEALLKAVDLYKLTQRSFREELQVISQRKFPVDNLVKLSFPFNFVKLSTLELYLVFLKYAKSDLAGEDWNQQTSQIICIGVCGRDQSHPVQPRQWH